MNKILITGAAKGLGRTLALLLAKEKKELLLHYRSDKKMAELARQCEKEGSPTVEILQGDFSTQEGICSFINQYSSHVSSTHTLIYTVGEYLVESLETTTQKQWLALFHANFFAPIFLMNELSDVLKIKQGRVILIGNAGMRGAKAYSKAAAYSMSKMTLYQTMLSYAKEWAPHQVTVNMVSPGFMENAIDLKETPLPMNRPATLEELARVVSFLLTPESSYITGQNIEVAGGFSL